MTMRDVRARRDATASARGTPIPYRFVSQICYFRNGEKQWVRLTSLDGLIIEFQRRADQPAVPRDVDHNVPLQTNLSVADNV